MKFPTAYALGALMASPSVNSLKFRATGRRNDAGALRRRGSLAGSSPLTDSADITYSTNITMGGQQFAVLIDTGSADLWVAGTVPNAKNSGKSSSVQYAIGSVEGPIEFAELQFSGFTVPDQAYLQVTPDSTNPAGTGLIGLGPVGGSNVYAALGSTTQGAGPLDRIFAQDPSTPNYLTVLLGRKDDPLNIFDGDMSIGEPLENYTSITSQPKLDVTIVPVRDSGDQHFQILLDANGIIGPDGKSIPVTSQVSGTQNKNQLTAVLDTGFSLSQVPKSVADAIYSRIEGAELSNVTGVGVTYIVPCNQEVNLTFQVGGVKYPVNPLDTTLDPSLLGMSSIQNSKGQSCCLAMFQPISFATGGDPVFDMILGMSFIRNVYALFNFGDFIAGSTSARGNPYLQFLSTTDSAKAHSDFVQVRLQGDDTTGTQTLQAAVPSATSSSSPWRPPTTYLIIGIVAFSVALLVALVSIIICQRRRRNNRRGRAAWGTYRPIDSPFQAPLNGQMHNPMPQGYNPHDGQVVYDAATYEKYGGYQNPWDHRY